MALALSAPALKEYGFSRAWYLNSNLGQQFAVRADLCEQLVSELPTRTELTHEINCAGSLRGYCCARARFNSPLVRD